MQNWNHTISLSKDNEAASRERFQTVPYRYVEEADDVANKDSALI